MTDYLSNIESADIWDSAMELCEDKGKDKEHSDLYFKLEKCKVCKVQVKLSCKYDGGYPLCYKHRNPNDRINK